ncbi:MAG: hypothetical protein HUU01_19855 [Saprospiraceae bacterium]|nr:hypothetical protein [Saprospiraceae bacterium]
MKSKGYALFLLLAIHISTGHAQAVLPEDYRVVEAALNGLFSKVQFAYYHPEKPINPRNTNKPLHPDATYVLVDPQTYEETVHSGKALDSILFSTYESEIVRYQLRDQYRKKLVLIGSFKTDDLHRQHNLYRDSETYKEILNAGIDITALQSCDWDAQLIGEHPDYFFRKLTDAPSPDFKYLIAAHIQLSNVVFDTNKNHALLELGLHHKIQNGTTGWGCYVLLSRTKGGWEVVKTYGLWEE